MVLFSLRSIGFPSCPRRGSETYCGGLQRIVYAQSEQGATPKRDTLRVVFIWEENYSASASAVSVSVASASVVSASVVSASVVSASVVVAAVVVAAVVEAAVVEAVVSGS